MAGMDGSPMEYPITDVYGALLWATEVEGLTLIMADASDYFLRVSYPFSLIYNNWGVRSRSPASWTAIGSGCSLPTTAATQQAECRNWSRSCWTTR